MRKTKKRELLRIARRRQRNVLCDVMLNARSARQVDAGRTGETDYGSGSRLVEPIAQSAAAEEELCPDVA